MSPYLMFGAIAVLGTMALRSRPSGRSGIDRASPPSNAEGQYNRNCGRAPHRNGGRRNFHPPFVGAHRRASWLTFPPPYQRPRLPYP